MQIGVVAKRVGVSVEAVRFYERNGLLPRPPRTEGGFRRYAEPDIETLAFVRRVQGLGFKLREIRGLLRLRGNRLQPCAPVKRRLEEKLADVQRKLGDLRKLEHELRVALRSCNRELRKRDGHCPILRDENGEGKVKVEVLYVAECPSHPAAVRLVRDVLVAEGVAADIREVLVRDEGMARELKFVGSPTIRVNGRDVAGETESTKNFALSCRLYRGSKQAGLPPAEMVHRAVVEASKRGR